MITTEWYFGTEDLADAHYIRREVFIAEQGVAESIEMDNQDGACVHLVAYNEGTPAATGRIHILGEDFIIGRVAVLPAFRGRHMGTLVMQMLIHACFLMQGERQVVHAQVSVRPFYERLGFTAVGEPYEEAGMPHILMEHFGDCSVICGNTGHSCGTSINR